MNYGEWRAARRSAKSRRDCKAYGYNVDKPKAMLFGVCADHSNDKNHDYQDKATKRLFVELAAPVGGTQ